MQGPISLDLLNLGGKGAVNKSRKAREEKQIKWVAKHQDPECLLKTQPASAAR